MKRVYVRGIRPDEADTFYGWAKENTVNEFDEQVPLFPSSTTWCAYDHDGPLAYQTLQQPLFLESLAPRPGASKIEIALALKELTQNAITLAHSRGCGEVYFLGSDEDTDKLAVNQIFERVNLPLFRVKLKDLTTCG